MIAGDDVEAYVAADGGQARGLGLGSSTAQLQ